MCKNILFTTVTISSLLFPAIVLGSPLKEGLDDSIIFMARKCTIEIQFEEDVYEKLCDRLVVTGADRKEDVNFHFDNSDKDGFSFIVNPQGKKVIEDDHLLLNKHRAFATFIWTKEDGIIEDSFIRGEGSCHILKTKVLCTLKAGDAKDNFRVNAFLEF